METTVNKNTSTLLQLSAFTQYFFPFGSFIFPTLIWSLKKNDSEFVNYNGKQAINFQLSLLLYTLILVLLSVPAILYAIFNGLEVSIRDNGEWIFEEFTAGRISGIVLVAVVAGFLYLIMKAAEFFLIFYASVKNSNGETYDFPLTIKFLK